MALHGQVEEENATRFPELTITARVENNSRREAFVGVPSTVIKYPNSLNIPSMKLSPALANNNPIEILRFGGVQIPGLRGLYEQITRMDCKFDFRWVGFDISTYNKGKLNFRFFNAQGVEIGSMVNDEERGKNYLTFKAPIGKLVSRIEIHYLRQEVNDSGYDLWSMDFEL